MIVGKIVKPQGIKGELKVEPLVSDVNLFYGFKTVLINQTKYFVKSVRIHEGFVFLTLNEVKDRNTSETLRNQMIEVEKSDLPNPDENCYYITDLVDCEIFFEDGEKLGKVSEVQNFGATDILFIKSGSEEILCPFLKKVFKDVDINAKKIIAGKQEFLEVTQSED